MINYDKILLRPGEIFLKGKNRNYFEKKLTNNIKKLINIDLKKLRFRFITDYFPEHQNLKHIFGLTSYSPAVSIEKTDKGITLENIIPVAVQLMKDKKGTFKIETKRADKTFPLISPQINSEIGKVIESECDLKLSFKDPDHILYLEINTEGAYLFNEIIKCFGGLPTGSEGRVILLIEDETSLLAGLLFMKRGCDIFPVSYAVKDAELKFLQEFSPAKLNLKILKDEKELTDYAQEKHLDVLVLDQTLDTYKKIDSNLLIFKPLIAYSEKKIKEELKKYKF